MPEATVFGDKRCHRRLTVFVKKTIMPDAEADHYIEICFLLVETQRLSDGITYHFSPAGSDFVFVRKPQHFFGNAATLAQRRNGFKPGALEELIKDRRFTFQTYAEGKTNRLILHVFAKLDDFACPGPATVSFRFDPATGLIEFEDRIFFQQLQ